MSLARNLTLKQLRALAETVRTGKVTAAAEALNVTPPAVSIQLKQLEEAIGIPLLEKHESGFIPTDAGRVLLMAARQIETAIDNCCEAVSAIKSGGGGTVRVGVVSTAKYFAPHALATFRRAHPNIDIRLSIGNRGETVAALEAYELDFAIMGRPPKRFEVEQSEIGPHPHVIIAPPDHRLADVRDISHEQLGGETFLMREPGSGTRMLTEWLLADISSTPEIGMEIGSNETIKQAVMAGLGIALISAHTVSVEVADGRLAILDVAGFPIERNWFVVRRSDKRLMPAAENLWEFIAREGRGFLPALPARPGAKGAAEDGPASADFGGP